MGRRDGGTGGRRDGETGRRWDGGTARRWDGATAGPVLTGSKSKIKDPDEIKKKSEFRESNLMNFQTCVCNLAKIYLF